jgi:hypothetical protein
MDEANDPFAQARPKTSIITAKFINYLKIH